MSHDAQRQRLRPVAKADLHTKRQQICTSDTDQSHHTREHLYSDNSTVPSCGFMVGMHLVVSQGCSAGTKAEDCHNGPLSTYLYWGHCLSSHGCDRGNELRGKRLTVGKRIFPASRNVQFLRTLAVLLWFHQRNRGGRWPKA